MVLKFRVELMEGALAQFVIALNQKRTERTLRKRCRATGLVGQDAEFHVHIGKLRKCVVVTAERDTTQREKAFLGYGKHIRLHPANFVQLDPPIGQRWIDKKLRESGVVDCLYFGDNKRARFTNLGEQILNLSDPRQVFVIRAVLGQLQLGVVIDAFDFQLERLFKLKYFGKRLRRLPYSTLPTFEFRIRPLKPAKILLPLADIRKELRQVPFVGLGNLRAGWNMTGRHLQTFDVQLSTPQMCCSTRHFTEMSYNFVPNARIAGWRAILRMAFSSNSFPGEILCHGDAPEGCGS